MGRLGHMGHCQQKEILFEISSHLLVRLNKAEKGRCKMAFSYQNRLSNQ
jgi:hypothetical protein